MAARARPLCVRPSWSHFVGRKTRSSDDSRFASLARIQVSFCDSTHFTAPRARALVAAIEQTLAEVRRISLSKRVIEVPVRRRIDLLCWPRASPDLGEAANLMGWSDIFSVAVVLEASAAFDIVAEILKVARLTQAPRPDLLHRSG